MGGGGKGADTSADSYTSGFDSYGSNPGLTLDTNDTYFQAGHDAAAAQAQQQQQMQDFFTKFMTEMQSSFGSGGVEGGGAALQREWTAANSWRYDPGTSFDKLVSELGTLGEGEYFARDMNEAWIRTDDVSHVKSGGYGYSASGASYGDESGNLDTLYGNYLSAGEQATDYVNEQIKQEKSRANLLNIEYDITEEEKASRISNQFANLWTSTDDQALRNLVDTWGEPLGFGGFTYNRGTASGDTPADDSGPGGPTGAADTGTGTIITDEEEDTLGSSTTILGG